MVHPSMVSALFQREIFDRCGAWDTVRVGADKEFLDRVRHNFGYQCMGEVLPSIPLSFSLDDARSLTRNKVTHSVTGKHGIRREYHKSAAHWRASYGTRNLRLILNRVDYFTRRAICFHIGKPLLNATSCS